MAARWPAALAGLSFASFATLLSTPWAFLQPAPIERSARIRGVLAVQRGGWRVRASAGPSQQQQQQQQATTASTGALAAVVLAGLAAPEAIRRARASKRPARDVAVRGWPFGDDPYSKCSAIKLQVGAQFSKSLLDALNRLAETADTSSDEGLHQLMLDVVLALRRAESSWRYGCCERATYDSEDEAQKVGATLQRWGIEGQSKWGDGEEWEKLDKSALPGQTDYLVVTILVGCYGKLCPEDDDLKVRSMKDLRKVLDAISGVQVDELMQLDVLWLPEEEGDTLSAMELTVKFPELAIL